MNKHNSERWFNEGGTVLDENRLPVAHVIGQDEDDSDARLMAAAPELLSVLRDVAALLPAAGRLHPDDLFKLQTRVCNAIATVEGRA